MKVLFCVLCLFSSLLLAQDKEAKSYLGVVTAEVEEALSSHVSLDKGFGRLIQRVVKGSPADQAGLLKFDILLKINEDDISVSTPLPELIHKYKPEEEVSFKLIRSGKDKEVKVTLGKFMPKLSIDELKNKLGKRFDFDLKFGGDEQFNQLGDDFKKRIREMTRRHFSTPGSMDKDLQKILESIARQPQGPNNFGFKGSASSIVTTFDGTHNIMVMVDGDTKTAKVTDKAGKIIFEGPINTQTEIDKIPESVRKKVTEMGDFKIKKRFH
jgi:serine protease Do